MATTPLEEVIPVMENSPFKEVIPRDGKFFA